MKVALCLSGLTRSVKFSWPLIKRYLVEPYNSDVFLHTWEDIDNEGMRPRVNGGTDTPSFLLETKENFIMEEINPKTYKLEDWEDFKKRDESELKLGLGETIAFSNYIVLNNKTLDVFRDSSIDLLNELEKGEE